MENAENKQLCALPCTHKLISRLEVVIDYEMPVIFMTEGRTDGQNQLLNPARAGVIMNNANYNQPRRYQT